MNTIRPKKGRKPIRPRSLRSATGAIDLASIMVGVIVIGVVGSVIASTVLAVVPWSQDEAAKGDLRSVVTAESVYKVQAESFGAMPDLVRSALIPEAASLRLKTDARGHTYTAYSRSASGQIFKVSHGGPEITVATPSEWDSAAEAPEPALTDPWIIADPGLRTSVMNMFEPGAPLTIQQAHLVTEVTVEPETVSLAGLEQALNLTTLQIEGSSVRTVPAVVAARLERLYAGNSHLETVPVLPRIKDLDVSGTEVTSLAPLGTSRTLENLGIDNTSVSDLSPLAEITTLTRLNAVETAVTEWAPVRRLQTVPGRPGGAFGQF